MFCGHCSHPKERESGWMCSRRSMLTLYSPMTTKTKGLLNKQIKVIADNNLNFCRHIRTPLSLLSCNNPHNLSQQSSEDEGEFKTRKDPISIKTWLFLCLEKVSYTGVKSVFVGPIFSHTSMSVYKNCRMYCMWTHVK